MDPTTDSATNTRETEIQAMLIEDELELDDGTSPNMDAGAGDLACFHTHY